MAILQGEIYWVDFGEEKGSKATDVHPGVVLQRDGINKSNINTVVVCMITSTLKRADAPGNVYLFKGEGGLRDECVVNGSLITHVNKDDLEYPRIGRLHIDRVQEIFEAIQQLLRVPTIRL